MKILAILGGIGSGKSFTSKLFGFPVFNADEIVKKIYRSDKKCFTKLKTAFPKYIKSFPVNKLEMLEIILKNKNNLKKINKIVHPIVRKKLRTFVNKNKNKKIIVLDIPLILENKIMLNKCIFIYVQAEKKIKEKKLVKRPRYNPRLFKIIKSNQLPLHFKKNISKFKIINDYKKDNVKKQVDKIKKKILSK
tara:strand:- start:1224 stop:1799 length:576 start_codon:yes stop_codon:yes gene_type:complete